MAKARVKGMAINYGYDVNKGKGKNYGKASGEKGKGKLPYDACKTMWRPWALEQGVSCQVVETGDRMTQNKLQVAPKPLVQQPVEAEVERSHKPRCAEFRLWIWTWMKEKNQMLKAQSEW